MRALAALLLLAGCTTATVDLADGTKVQFTRFWSEADLELTPDSLHYSSSPSAVAAQNSQDLLARALAAALGVAVPVPGVRSQPQAYRPLTGFPEALALNEVGI